MTDAATHNRRVLVAFTCVFASLLLAACGSAAQSSEATGSSQPLPAGFKSFTVTTPEGRLRSYIVYASSSTAKDRPLVLVYHGAEATAEGTAQETDFVQAAERDGFDVAFMQGYEDTWNEGAGGTPARVAHVNDVEYTSAVLSQIERNYSIDPRRVAASGFSNGALLTELLGCQLADRLAVVVPVEGPLPVSVSRGCHPAQPISVLEIHGTADPAIPYGGGHFDGVGGGTTVLSAPASAARWASLNGCRGSARSSQQGGKVLLRTYSPCRRGVVVKFRALVGGAHSWPPEIGVLVDEFLAGHPQAPATGRSG